MIRSQPIEVEGRFVGVAVQSGAAWNFLAIEPLLGDLDGAVFPTPAEARRVAGAVLTRARTAPPPVRLRPKLRSVA